MNSKRNSGLSKTDAVRGASEARDQGVREKYSAGANERSDKEMRRMGKPCVFVGLSGGVDSSVSAALLKKDGYKVVGVFIRTWQPDFIECSFREDRLDAMRVAAHLDIPFLECDAEEEYKKSVADYMVAEYKAGRTPNPDVMCNREIKFGVFWNFAKARGADFVATGHYSIAERTRKNRGTDVETIFNLKKGADPSKDQSYFLWTLNQDDLSHILFPIGHLKKTEVRKMAEKFGLPTAVKKDSQGICMLGDLNLKDFLAHYLPSKQGIVLNESGEAIGHHDGAMYLTLGERHGFTIEKNTPNSTPYYIVAKDIEKNTITVSHETKDTNAKKTFLISLTNWISNTPESGKNYTCQIRYHGEYLSCHVKVADSKTAEVTLDAPQLISSGQSLVVYDSDVCLGGGIII